MNDDENIRKENRKDIGQNWTNDDQLNKRIIPFDQFWRTTISRPWNCNLNNVNGDHKEINSIRWTNWCRSVGINSHNNSNVNRVFLQNWNSHILRPIPLKNYNGIKIFASNNNIQTNIDLRITKQQKFNNFELRGEFAQELEDRIQADLEIKSILEVDQQDSRKHLSKSLPERPENPIINDNFFKKEVKGSSNSVNNISAKYEEQSSLSCNKLNCSKLN